MTQLQLTAKHLRDIGFTKHKKYTGLYTIPVINGFITCNRKEPKYKWYLQIIIGDFGNQINLNITSAPELFTFLQVIGAKHNLIII